VQWVKRLINSLSLQRPKFDPSPGRLGFLLDKVAMGQVFSIQFGFPLSLLFHQGSIYMFHVTTIDAAYDL
jgi:hypothetical protein